MGVSVFLSLSTQFLQTSLLGVFPGSRTWVALHFFFSYFCQLRSMFGSQMQGIMLYFEIKIVIGLRSIAVVDLLLVWNMNEVSLKGSNSFL